MAKKKLAADAEQRPAPEPPTVPLESPPAGVAERPSAVVPQRLLVDDSAISGHYANFARVTGTPEELIVDFGLNIDASQRVPAGPQAAVSIDRRIVLSFLTAKRLWSAVHMAVQRHEATFGPVETDVRRRLNSAAKGPSQPRG
jgi:hypothetical protein